MSFFNRETKLGVGNPGLRTGDLFRLDGRTILLSGGGGALALEVGRGVIESGGDIVCFDLLERPDAELWNRVQDACQIHDGRAWYYRCDVTDEENVMSTLREAATQTRHPVRGLVACAGLSGDGPSTEFSLERARRILDVNVMGHLICARAIARDFQQRAMAGSVVLIASMSGHGTNRGVDTAAYNSSKAAVHQLTRSLAAEWASNPDFPLIRVNSISPGYIRTLATAETLKKPGMEDLWSRDNMMMRLSEAHEFRGPAVFLLSDASSFMTGSDLRVDGGHTAW